MNYIVYRTLPKAVESTKEVVQAPKREVVGAIRNTKLLSFGDDEEDEDTEEAVDTHRGGHLCLLLSVWGQEITYFVC